MDATSVIFEYEGEAWLRTGECCRCGDCCRGNPFADDGAEFCPLFAWLSEGVGHCTDRTHPYYLQGCNSFPEHPTQISDKPNCSYHFVRIR